MSNLISGDTETAPLRIRNLIDNEQKLNPAYGIAFVLVLVAVLAILLGALLRRGKKI